MGPKSVDTDKKLKIIEMKTAHSSNKSDIRQLEIILKFICEVWKRHQEGLLVDGDNENSSRKRYTSLPDE